MPEILSEQLEKYDSIIKKIQEKYPLCEIKGIKDWYMPLEMQELIYKVVTPRKVTILEEFLLSAATSELQNTLSIETLSDLLSLDEVFINSCVEELCENDIIKKNELPNIVITDLGRDYFKHKAVPAKPTTEKITYYIDRKFGTHYYKIFDTKDLTIPKGNEIIENHKENIKKYINKEFVISVGKEQGREIEEPNMKKRFLEAVSVKTFEKSHTLITEFWCYDAQEDKNFRCIWDHAKTLFREDIAEFIDNHYFTNNRIRTTEKTKTESLTIDNTTQSKEKTNKHDYVIRSTDLFGGYLYSYPIYDAEGYDENGFDRNGYDREGYDKKGFNADGYNRGGFDINGYDKDGYNEYGFNDDGFTKDGMYDERIGARVEHISCGAGRIIGFYEKDGKKHFAVKYDNPIQKNGKFLFAEKVLNIVKFIDITPNFDD